MSVAFRAYILDEFDSDFQTKIFTMSSIQTGLARIGCYLLLAIGTGFVWIFSDYDKSNNDQNTNEYFTENMLIVDILIQFIGIVIAIATVIIFYRTANEITIGNYSEEKNKSEETSLLEQPNFANRQKRSGKSEMKSILDTVFKTIFTNNHSLLSIFIATMIGYICRYSIHSRGSQITFDTFFRDEILFHESIAHTLYHVVDSIIMILFCFFLYSCVNQGMHRSLTITYTFAMAIMPLMYLMKLLPESSTEYYHDSRNIGILIGSTIPMVSNELIFAHLNCLPFCVIRNTVKDKHFGVSVAHVLLAQAWGQFIAEMANWLLNQIAPLSDSGNDMTTVEIIEKQLYFVPVIMLICFVGALSSRLFSFTKSIISSHSKLDLNNSFFDNNHYEGIGDTEEK